MRDTLAGENPFDQLAPWNWLNDKGRTTGRQLLRKHGAIGKKDHWSNWIGGTGAEIALDPLTYMTFGASALSKAGKVAKAAGHLDDVTKLAKVGPRVGRMTTTLEDLVSGLKTPTGDFAEGAASSVGTRRSIERAAKGAGQNLDEIYNMPLGGLVRPVGPLSGLGGQTGVWGKAGGMGQKIAGKMDTVGQKLSESAPGRFGAMVFEHGARGLYGKEDQKLARMVTTEQAKAGPLGRMAAMGLGDVVNPALREFENVASDEIMGAAQRRTVGPAADAMRNLPMAAPVSMQKQAQKRLDDSMEAFNAIDRATEIRRVADRIARHTGEHSLEDALRLFDVRVPADKAKNVQAAVDKIQAFTSGRVQRVNEKGGGVQLLDEESIGHLGRYANVSKSSFQDSEAIKAALSREAATRGVDVKQLSDDVVKRVTEEAGPQRAFKLAGTKTAIDMARSQETRTVPAAVVDEMLTDPNLRVRPGTPEGQVVAAQHAMDTYGQYLDPKYKGRSAPQAAFDLASWSEKNKGRPGFTEMMQRQAQKLSTPESKNAIEQHAWELAQHVRTHARKPRYTNEVMEDVLRYSEAVHRKEGMLDAVHHYLRQNAGKVSGVPVEQVFRDAGMDDKAVEYFAKQGGLSVEQARHLNVPHDVAAAVGAVVRTQPGSVWGNKVGEVIDWANDFMRKNITLPFPAFHVRNFSSGQYINMATGAMQSPEDFSTYKTAYMEAMALRNNPADPMWREIKAFRVHGGQSGERGARGFEDVPYGDQQELPQFIQNTPGLRTVGTGYQKVIGLGGKALEKVEFYNRVPLYLYFRKKGYEPLQAALEVKKRHFDYKELTDIERNLFRRGILFFSFTRKMAPLIAETLTQRPGGAMAQTIKATAKLHDKQDQPVPQYIKETTAIPLKPDAAGNLRYFTGLGLPQEDIASFIPSPVQELLSRTTPLIKAPIEMATGQSLFQRGRPLDELDPTIGRIIGNVKELAGGDKVKTRAKPFLGQPFEFTMANSPLSRVLSTVRTATDPRKSNFAKAINLGTGLRITDVSPAAQDAEIRARAADAMKKLGAKTFSRTYVPQDDREGLSPEEKAQLAQLDLLLKQLQARSKERAK